MSHTSRWATLIGVDVAGRCGRKKIREGDILCFVWPEHLNVSAQRRWIHKCHWVSFEIVFMASILQIHVVYLNSYTSSHHMHTHTRVHTSKLRCNLQDRPTFKYINVFLTAFNAGMPTCFFFYDRCKLL